MSEQQHKPSRRQQILEALAHELETSPGERITTAGLARAVGVSEAALYRHFPSKARMFEGLIEFIEETVFGLITRILAEETSALRRCEKILLLLLGFAERNAGMSRILMGDALTGERDRLRARIAQFYDRLEIQLKQVLREGELRDELHLGERVSPLAGVLLAAAVGRIHQFVRSGFEHSPLVQWEAQWCMLREGLLASGLTRQDA